MVATGTLLLGNNMPWGPPTMPMWATYNTAMLYLGGNSPMIHNISTFQSTATLAIGNGTLTLNNSSGFAAAWAGIITGSGKLVICNGDAEPSSGVSDATKTVTLSGSNAFFTGTLQQSNGVLVCNNSAALQYATVDYNCTTDPSWNHEGWLLLALVSPRPALAASRAGITTAILRMGTTFKTRLI